MYQALEKNTSGITTEYMFFGGVLETVMFTLEPWIPGGMDKKTTIASTCFGNIIPL